jgi:hypothetical protein
MSVDPVFDVRKLDDFQLGHLQFVLNSPSYMDVFLPYLKNIRESFSIKMLDRTQQRKDLYNDDFLAGGIIVIDGLLTFFNQLLDETDMGRIADSQAITGEQQYELLRQEGIIGSGGAGPQIKETPYDPSLDF